jgi:predicted nucleotidyltransferase
MPTAPPADPRLAEVARLADDEPHLRLLLLYGSRARGDAHARSDWDFGYLADPEFDALALEQRIARHLEGGRQPADP